MSAADAQERAEALISDAEAKASAFIGKVFHSDRYKDLGSACAYEVGVLRGVVRNLCHELEALGSIDGISQSIRTLGHKHALLLEALRAVHSRIDDEAAREITFGYDAVADALNDALTCMNDCGELDEDELRAKRAGNYFHTRADERRDDPPEEDIKF